jgi:hypothetical protein
VSLEENVTYNSAMLTAPQQNWPLYQAMSIEADRAWLRGLSTAQRFAIYQGFFNAICNARGGGGDRQRLESSRWQEKLAIRRRMVEAFGQLDQRGYE